MTSWYVHMPGLALDAPDPATIGPGRLTHLPFTRWHAIDGSFPWAASDYAAAMPVFFVGDGRFSPRPRKAFEQVAAFSRRLHLALLLDTEAPMMPSPSLSMAYVVRDVKGVGEAHWADVGPFGKEWVVFGRQATTVIDGERLKNARVMYRLLDDAERSGFPGGVEAGLDALERTMRPELWLRSHSLVPPYVFVDSIMAAEHLLLPPRQAGVGGPGLTVTFGQHAAVLTHPSRNDLEERASELAGLYRLRSRLVHGEIGGASLRQGDRYRLWLGASLFRFVLIRALDLGAQGHLTRTTLPRLLADAWADPARHAALFSRELGANAT